MMSELPPPEMPRAALHYRAMLAREMRREWGLDGPVALMGAQIHQESGYDPNAKSAYASGLAQFTPSTAVWISGVYKDLGAAAPLDPAWALRAMVRYDKVLHDAVRVANTECDRWLYTMSDYNGGSGRRIGRQARSLDPGNWAVTSKINPGISQSNQRENASYPYRIAYVLQTIYKSWSAQMVCDVRS